MPQPSPSGDAPDPLAPLQGLGLTALLDMLEHLDGREEADVVRSALAAGVPEPAVVEELRREVERRVLRAHGFYDRGRW